jgi:hypothetical protein
MSVIKGASHVVNIIEDGAFRIHEFTAGDDDITIA